MGLSSIYFTVVLAFLAITAAMGMMMMAADYSKSDVDMKDRTDILEPQMKSAVGWAGFNSTNITAEEINVTLYLENTGSTNLQTDCLDLFIDLAWVDHSDLETLPRPSTFDPMLWNPSEQLQLSTLQDIDVGEHNATVVTCGGVAADGRFNASKCGDGTCTGGEYCGGDDLSCDLFCYTTRCEDGCFQQLVPAGGVDNLGLFCNETGGCDTDSCVCDGAGNCCGAGGSTCIQDGECCSGSCPPPGPEKTCSPYP